MIDSHCHLDIAAFDLDRAEVVARAQAAGVIGMLVPAIRPANWANVGTVAGQFVGAGVRTAFGIHPQFVPILEIGEIEQATSVDGLCHALTAADQAAQLRGAAPMVAVGECGLDGATPMFERQEQLFRLQLRAARELKLPVVVHVLRAHHRAPAIMREERVDTVGGIMHSYSGGVDLLPVYRDLGLAFSFAGPVTFAGSRRPLGAAMQVPLELLLVETDAPDQAPTPHRGSRSEPAQVVHTLAAIAAARQIEPTQLAAITVANTHRVLPAWNARPAVSG
ncbi:MAG: TatD family hydrolase [Kofleriaceae bacterium]|nr:TatD family hydrolase [Kofleriaceae bacterium]